MKVNPYASPGTSPIAPEQITTGFTPTPLGAPERWTVREVLAMAWRAFRPQWVTLTAAAAIETVAALAMHAGSLYILHHALHQGPQPLLDHAISFVMGRLGGSIFMAGAITMWIGAIRGETVTLSQLGARASRWPACFLVELVAAFPAVYSSKVTPLVDMVTEVFLVLPAFYVVDRDISVGSAYREGFKVIRRSMSHLFLLGLATVVLVSGGLLACGIGLFPAAAMWDLLIAAVYCKETGTTAALLTAPFSPPAARSD